MPPPVEPTPAPSELEGNLTLMMHHPIYADRRVVLDAPEIMNLLWASLEKRGAQLSIMVRGNWIWTYSPENHLPRLYYIRPVSPEDRA